MTDDPNQVPEVPATAAPASAGGETLPDNIYTSGFYNINSGVQVNNLQGLSKTMFPGSNVYDRWFGFDLGLSLRLPDGIIVQGGLSTGHQTTDFCDVQDPAKAGENALVEMLGSSSLQTCHMEQNWLPQVKFLGSYPRARHPGEPTRATTSAPPGTSDEDFAESQAWLARLRSGR